MVCDPGHFLHKGVGGIMLLFKLLYHLAVLDKLLLTKAIGVSVVTQNWPILLRSRPSSSILTRGQRLLSSHIYAVYSEVLMQ